MTAPRYFALIPAAGVGARLGAACPKQYMPIAGKPMLLHSLETLAGVEAIAHCFIVVSAGDAYIAETLDRVPQLAGKFSVVYDGGATRQESVRNGLVQMRSEVADDDWVLVHDAARPGLTRALVERLITTLRDDDIGGLLALPVVDTLKRSDEAGRAQATVARAGLWAAQTPQMFRYALLLRALRQPTEVTDEASAMESLGMSARLVPGSARNFKVTLPEDIALAELLLKGIE